VKGWLLPLAVFTLSGCGQPLLEVCRACLETDARIEVAKKDYPRVTLVHGSQPLPESASNVYLNEKCGIDCVQMLRFDSSLAEARSYAATALVDLELRKDFNPWKDGRVFDPWKGSEGKMPWWPADIRGVFYGGETGGAQPLKIAIVPRGDRATVLVTAFDL